MAKTPILPTDLEAKGYRLDKTGAYAWDGIPSGKAPEVLTKMPKKRPAGLVAIENVLKASRVSYVTEYRFSADREFKFDIAILDMNVGIEYEGIFSEKSRHTGVKGYTEDANKYNLAQLEGWKVLRYTAKNYKNFLDDLTLLITLVAAKAK